MNIERHAVRGEHVEIPVTGMGCAQRIQWAPSKLDGVIHITVSHAEAKAHIHYSPDQILASKQFVKRVIRPVNRFPPIKLYFLVRNRLAGHAVVQKTILTLSEWRGT